MSQPGHPQGSIPDRNSPTSGPRKRRRLIELALHNPTSRRSNPSSAPDVRPEGDSQRRPRSPKTLRQPWARAKERWSRSKSFENDVQELRATVASLESNMEDLRAADTSPESNMEELRATVASLETTLIDLRSDINRVEREAHDKNQEQDGSIDRLNAEMDALRREMDGLVSCACASMQESAADGAAVEKGSETEEDLARKLAREQANRVVDRAAEKRAADTARYGRDHEMDGPSF